MKTHCIGDWVGPRTLRDGYEEYRSKCAKVFDIELIKIGRNKNIIIYLNCGLRIQRK